MIELMVCATLTTLVALFITVGLLFVGGWLYIGCQHKLRDASLEEIEEIVEGR